MPEIDFSGLPDKAEVPQGLIGVPTETPIVEPEIPSAQAEEAAPIDFSGLPDKAPEKADSESMRLPSFDTATKLLPNGIQHRDADVKDSLSLAAAYDISPQAAYSSRDKFKEELKQSSLWDKAAGSLKAGMGDVYAGMGGVMELAGFEGEAADVYKNYGERLRLAYIPPADTSAFTYKKVIDPEWWATSVTRSVPFTLSLIPSAIVGAYGGAAAAGVAGLGAFGTTVLASIGGASLSRPLESAFEAASAKEEALAKGMSEAEAEKAAAEVFKGNMTLVGLDAAQFAVAFTPLRYGAGLKSTILKRMAAGSGKLSAVAISEAGEERYQEYLQMQAMEEEGSFFDIDNPRLNEASTIGGIFGLGMGGAGSVWTSLTKEVTKDMPGEIQTTYDTVKADAIAEGKEENAATLEALDAIAELPEGKEYLDGVVQDLKERAEGTMDVAAPVEEVAESPITEEEAFERFHAGEITEEELFDIAVEGRGPLAEEIEEGDTVNEIKQRLLDTGMSEEEATTNAVIGRGIDVLARQAGLSVEEVRERYLPEVTREGVEPVIEDGEVLEQAQTQGFEGEVGTEAVEWNRAVEKGLDMAQEARLSRAKEMGFDIEQVWYHGTRREFSEFEASKPRGAPGNRVGIYFTKNKRTAEEYALNEGENPLDEKSRIIKVYLKEPELVEGDREIQAIIIDPSQIRSVNAAFDPEFKESAQILAQETAQEPTAPGDAPRGRIRFAPEGITIELLKDADASTFSHEMGHLYFRMLADLSQVETASESLKADYETIRGWLNVPEGSDVVTVEQQEQFARGWEAYLREGKAPSPELATAFENFKQWFMEVYRSLKELNVELTDDVRGVFDRLLAEEGVEVLPESDAEVTYDQSGIIKTETPQFKEWFGDSKVVDEGGKPLVVYHGTSETFDAFDPEKTPGGIIWFTSDREAIERGEVGAGGKGIIKDVYLSIENPAGWNEYEKLGIGQIVSRGFDGVILPDSDGTTYIAFEPTQVKSIDNKGTFSPTDPSIFEQAPSPGLVEQREKDLQATKKGDIFNIKRDIQKLKEGNYVPERVFAEAQEGIESESFNDATDFLRRFHEERTEILTDREVRNTPTSTEQAQREKIKQAESVALKEWAQENNLWRDSAAFYAQWEKQGQLGGAEHLVVISPDGKTVRKLASASMNATIHEYLSRLQIHNFYFPESSYSFLGMSENAEGNPIIMVQQKGVDMSKGSFIKMSHKIKGRSPGDLRRIAHEYIAKMGFEEKVFDDYKDRHEGKALGYHYFVNEDGVVIHDLHHDNVIHRPDGTLDFIDPVITFDPSTQLERLQRMRVDEGVEVFDQPAQIKNIRQLVKSLGGINYNREHMKGELDKLKEDAPATRFIINRKNEGVTLDQLLTSAIDEGILTDSSDINDLLRALEINLETPAAIEEELAKDERARQRAAGKEFEFGELKKAFIEQSAKVRKAFKEGKAAGIEKESRKLKNILARSRKIRIVRDYLSLTDADMKKLTTKNPVLMDQWEFKQFIDDLRVRAVELSENKLQKAMLIHQIYEKDLSNVDNYRNVLGFPTITKMTTEQAREFAIALDQFADGSSFLTVRQLQLIDRTELEGARTYEEAKAVLSEKTGLSIEELSQISITEWTKFKWDTALAESDPFLNLLVRGVNEKLLEANIRAFDIETKVHKLAKKSEKSRARTFLEKIIPQDKLIFEYLETPGSEKDAVMANMTKEQIDLAHYMQEYFANALEYLIQVKGLEQGRANYITHVRRGMLENIKEEGLNKAVSSMFTAMQEDYATFNIGTDQHILPLDKFFQYEMRRTGVIEPSENVINVFLHYVKTFEKMVLLNEIMPVMDIYAQSITPQIYTPKGLEMDKSIKNFVHDYINNKKGRRITAAVIDKQGGVVDVLLRSGKTLTSFLDLGWNVFSGLAATGGEQITNYQMLGTKKFTKGNARISTKKGKAILEKYAAVIGRSSWEGMFAPGEDILDRTMTSAFALFNEASRLANKQFILGSITDAEYNSGEITSERMTEVLLDMGRFRVVPGTKSLVGSTSVGGTMTQYKTWAVPPMRTNIKNLIDTAKNLKTKPVGEALAQREAIEIYRLVGLTLTAYTVWAMVGADEEDDSFAGQLLNKVKRETFTLIQAVDPTLFFGDPRLSSFLQQLAKNIKMSLFLEEYKTKPGLKGVEGFKRQLTPRAIKQFQTKEERRRR